MKAGKEHRVPLSDAALAVLGEAGALVFGSETKPGKPISDMSIGAVLRRVGRDGITVHGFRSTFRDWAGETTGFPREVIEAALAHGIKDKAEAAYSARGSGRGGAVGGCDGSGDRGSVLVLSLCIGLMDSDEIPAEPER